VRSSRASLIGGLAIAAGTKRIVLEATCSLLLNVNSRTGSTQPASTPEDSEADQTEVTSSRLRSMLTGTPVSTTALCSCHADDSFTCPHTRLLLLPRHTSDPPLPHSAKHLHPRATSINMVKLNLPPETRSLVSRRQL
jgi:hypothetical protein